MHEAPDRLKHVFEWYGIQPEDTPERARLITDGWVYFIKCDGYTKIGKTRHKPEHRLIKLQSGNPYDLTITKAFLTADCEGAEVALHDQFVKYHHRLEWYKLPQRIIGRIVRATHIEEILIHDGLPLALSTSRSDNPDRVSPKSTSHPVIGASATMPL